jgi:indole-3-glycerol phosphate synthase
MTDFLDKLLTDAEKRIKLGYYDKTERIDHNRISLSHAIRNAPHNAIIAEIKPKSPSRGPLRPGLDPSDIAMRLERGGAIGLSILTEPDNFGGELTSFTQVRRHVNLPLLMKDVIIDNRQIAAAERIGADCILIMESALLRKKISQTSLIREAHNSGLEVLLEVHDKSELNHALHVEADLVGINNRNLTNLTTNLNTTQAVLASGNFVGKTIITESGIETAEDVRNLKRVSVNGFLIGSSIMLTEDVEKKVREFVLA